MGRRAVVAVLTVVGLLALGLPGGAEGSDRVTAGRDARTRLVADSSGDLVVRSSGRVLRFVGVPAAGVIDNPAVGADSTAAAAADAHVDRYAAAFGAKRPGTTLERRAVARAASGNDVVRYDQYVDGLPVIGGELVVGLRPDRSLASMLGHLSTVESVPAAAVTRQAAAVQAGRQAARATGSDASGLTVVSQGRWLYDPSVAGVTTALPPRSVWRFEVNGAADQRRLVLVDDQLGRVVADLDLVADLDRVVCDRSNVSVPQAQPCTSGFARVEGGPASAVGDVNAAYDLSGAVSAFYQQTVGLDVTDLLGVAVAGVKKLASTVRYCQTGSGCPYQNAFWNGTGMYYGDGWASADDVTGHEMTHGVIERNSNLFYWGQSGAINESLADIMGEILDHRYATPGDTANDWRMGEDLVIGAIRDLSAPTTFGQPDRMTSGLYTDDVANGYGDQGGVHTNSGVGNKTAYLISQGGTFNGQTMTGIDAGDPGLTKTAVLYYDVIQSLSSGSGYADLADVLDQSCQDLVAGHASGFTAATCATVHAATVATELRTTPTNAAQPADAPDTCASGTQKRVLFDSETGDPASKLTGAGNVWARGQDIGYGSNASSGTESWFGWDLDPQTYGDPTASSLSMTSSVALPAGQPAYLHFNHWWLFEYGFDNGTELDFDGGTVEVDDVDDAAGPVDTAGLPWVNGPSRVLYSWSGNTNGGRTAFAGDSRGYLGSRLDLSSLAGHHVKVQFTTRGDEYGTFIGWYLDDITVYTCDPVILNAAPPTITGATSVGSTLTATPGDWTPQGLTFHYAWLRDGQPVPDTDQASYVLGAADVGHRISVRVTATKPPLADVSATSAATEVVKGQVVAGTPRIAGKAKVGKTLRAKPGSWSPAGVALDYRWLRDGKQIGGATGSTYTLRRVDRGKRISVRVTGSAPDYLPASATSPPTDKVT